jgi:hypothetical protein
MDKDIDAGLNMDISLASSVGFTHRPQGGAKHIPFDLSSQIILLEQFESSLHQAGTRSDTDTSAGKVVVTPIAGGCNLQTPSSEQYADIPSHEFLKHPAMAQTLSP